MRSLDETHAPASWAGVERLLMETRAEAARLTARQAELLNLIRDLQQEQAALHSGQVRSLEQLAPPAVTNESPQEAKIALFRSLFRGREDVYPRRFVSLKTGKTGYQPACRNPWADDPADREPLPLTDAVVRNHLLGADPQDRSGRDFTIGVYPMLPDETCWFLAADFDKASWPEDTPAFLETCRHFHVPVVLERSRSGNGGHVWIFFAEPVPAGRARKVGAFLLTQTMERRPETPALAAQVQVSAWTPMTASSLARTHSPPRALAI